MLNSALLKYHLIENKPLSMFSLKVTNTQQESQRKTTATSNLAAILVLTLALVINVTTHRRPKLQL